MFQIYSKLLKTLLCKRSFPFLYLKYACMHTVANLMCVQCWVYNTINMYCMYMICFVQLAIY